MKTCWTCKHYWQEMKGLDNLCLRSSRKPAPSLITGEQDIEHDNTLDCFDERYKDGECGKEGKFWEPIK